MRRHDEFELAALDFCVTYEVSPPTWEPPSPRFRLDDSAPPPPAPVFEAPVIDDAPTGDAITLSGELVGKAEAELHRLSNYAAEHRHITVDCRGLKRVDFTAAGALLNWAVGLQAQGKSAEFIKVGHLIAALFVVMGLHEVAHIERKQF